MKDDPFYGTRFGKFVLLLLVAMLNSFLIGWGIFILAPDGGWLRTLVGLLVLLFWGCAAMMAIILFFGTYIQIRICLTHRRNRRKRRTNDRTTNNPKQETFTKDEKDNHCNGGRLCSTRGLQQGAYQLRHHHPFRGRCGTDQFHGRRG